MDDSDSDDNLGVSDLGDSEKGANSLAGSNLDHDNFGMRKISDNSNDAVQIKHRFTIVENNFSEDVSDYKDDSVNISKNNESSKSNNNSKIKESNNKKSNKNKDKSEINFIDFKIILVGDVAVGKTSIIGRYINNSFDKDYKCTIQAEQQTKIIKEDNNTSVRLNIWDTVGQEKFRSITRQFYRDCQGAIIVFDLTQKKTFDYIPTWISEIKNYGNNDTIIIILGNKSDLTKEREILPNDIKKELNDEYLYYEVSAKNGNNISMAFDTLKKLIMENKIKNERKNRKKKDKQDQLSQSLNEFDEEFNEKNRKCC